MLVCALVSLNTPW